MQKFILLRGHEGSGKSTFAREKMAEFQRIYPDGEVVLIDNDEALINEHGIYHFDFEQFTQAHRDNVLRQNQAFERGLHHPERAMLVINANPNQKSKTCYAQIERARLHGFMVEIYRLHHDFPNVHGVAPEDVARSRTRLDANPVLGEIHLP
ncbi:MAG: hypothetical protein Q4B82_02985 [Alysiella sp.]|uniref:ATP-binding protein n=1 Tax=Alysiella sp. TaxID=1872483 RepID=UPI0026DB4E1F|nr:hypothetical protein [Alysiella sp.]MDO4433532.1 hypothetical protein [Alysiella sp.]